MICHKLGSKTLCNVAESSRRTPGIKRKNKHLVVVGHTFHNPFTRKNLHNFAAQKETECALDR